jgi:general secretion pathway protein K
MALRVLASRPPAGWNSPNEFWSYPAVSALGVPTEAQQQVRVRTEWFMLDISSSLAETQFFQTALVDARLQPARVVRRRWERDAADAIAPPAG